MKKLFLLLFLFFTTISYSQEIHTYFDKFEKTTSISLEEPIELQENIDEGTGYFYFNIYKIFNEKDTSFIIKIVGISGIINSIASDGLEMVFLINNLDLLKIISIKGTQELKKTPGGGYAWYYYLNYNIQKEDIIKLYTSNSIDIRCYLHEKYLSANFNKNNKKDLKMLIKNLLNFK